MVPDTKSNSSSDSESKLEVDVDTLTKTHPNPDHPLESSTTRLEREATSKQETLTRTSWLAAICGCCAGFSYGYETTLASGLLVIPSFVEKFFPGYQHPPPQADSSPYCMSVTSTMTIYVAIIFLPAAFIAPASGQIANRWGRRNTFLLGAWILLIANILRVAAVNSAMIWAGRVIAGIAMALLTTVAPMFIAEMSPAKFRGRSGAGFSMSNAVGQTIAFVVDLGAGTWNNPNSWRISFACGMWSAILMLILLHFFLPDTPSSLLYRGKMVRAESAFKRIRCINRTESNKKEWEMMREEALRSVTLRATGSKSSMINWSKIKKVFTIIPAFTIMFHLGVVRMWTGCIAIIYFTSVIFKGSGSTTSFSLLAQFLIGIGTIAGSIVSLFLFDKVGRRRSLVGSAAGMSVCTAIAAVIMGVYLDPAPGSKLPSNAATGLVVCFVVFQFFFFAAWAASYWVITSEVYPLAIRSAASGVGISMQFIAVFVSALTSPSMACSLHYGAFIFFACINAYLVFFSSYLLLETKGLKLQQIETMWRRHGAWKNFLRDDEDLGKLDEDIEVLMTGPRVPHVKSGIIV